MKFQLLALAFLALVCFVTVASSSDLNESAPKLTLWSQFKQKYGKIYPNSSEEKFRLSIFLKRLREIDNHNSQPDSSYKMGLNNLADWTTAETSRLNGLRLPAKIDYVEPTNLMMFGKPAAEASTGVPEALNWADIAGVVGPVKTQGDCGSCWAFATTGLLEGQERLNKTGAFPVSLSEQQLVDCDRHGGDSGCNGGMVASAIEYIVESSGLETESDYPYESMYGDDNYKCKHNKTKSFATTKKIVKAEILQLRNEEALRDILAKYGPIAVGVYATESLIIYKKGIYADKGCGYGPVNHAVLLVGYGTESGVDYWIIKNSWSQKWGEKGFFRLARNQNGLCGILTAPTIVIDRN